MPPQDLEAKLKEMELRLAGSDKETRLAKEQLDATKGRLREGETRIAELQAQVNASGARMQEWQAKVKASEQQAVESRAQAGAAQSAVTIMSRRLKDSEAGLAEAKSALAQLAAERDELRGRLEAGGKARPGIEVNDLLRQFRSHLEEVNQELMRQPGPRVVVEKMEVELKAGVDLQKGIRLTQLEAPEMSPRSVSTVRFSLRPAAGIKIIDDQND
ncbi:MAG: hypothetical protein V2A77_00765 [Pseudomonadota bacterium]